MNAPTRPVVRWLGGKWQLAPWIVAQFPPHRVYVEAFGGGGSVLIRKPRAYAEIYNDLDTDVVNLFRVLRQPSEAERLISLLRLTPFARAEFEMSYVPAADPVEAARRLVARSFMGFGSNGHNPATKTGFRSSSNRSGTTPAHDWASYPAALATTIERLSGVVIENRPATDVMDKHDGDDALHYVDPPYVHSTRSDKRKSGEKYHVYQHEMTDDEHVALLGHLDTLKGAVVLSGYPSDLYDSRLSAWRRISCPSLADGARPRTEVLWLNPAASCRLAAAAQQVSLAL